MPRSLFFPRLSTDRPGPGIAPGRGVVSRRAAVAGALSVALVTRGRLSAAPDDAEAQLTALEARSRGRLGVAILDTASGRTLDYRARERFALCSTFKFLLVAAILCRVDQGREHLERRVRITPRDILSGSPLTAAYGTDGAMTVLDLCEAAVTRSDNAAANLLLAAIGGPEALTRFARSIGDPGTRLDRHEPELNDALPGNPRDTTTPQHMLRDLRALILGTYLSETSRTRLRDWLVGCRTGAARLRAGLPTDWTVGDKTGTGDHGTSNDVAIAWPPGRPPVLVTAYLTESPLSSDERDAVLADIARLVTAQVGA